MRCFKWHSRSYCAVSKFLANNFRTCCSNFEQNPSLSKVDRVVITFLFHFPVSYNILIHNSWKKRHNFMSMWKPNVFQSILCDKWKFWYNCVYLMYVCYSGFPKIDIIILRNPITSYVTPWLKETEQCMNEIGGNKNNNKNTKKILKLWNQGKTKMSVTELRMKLALKYCITSKWSIGNTIRQKR